MTDRKLIIEGIKKIDEGISFFNEIKNKEAHNIMLDLSNGLRVSADRLLNLVENESLL